MSAIHERARARLLKVKGDTWIALTQAAMITEVAISLLVSQVIVRSWADLIWVPIVLIACIVTTITCGCYTAIVTYRHERAARQTRWQDWDDLKRDLGIDDDQ